MTNVQKPSKMMARKLQGKTPNPLANCRRDWSDLEAPGSASEVL